MSFEAILKTITNKLNPFTTEKLGILLNKIKNKDSESELNLENIIDDLLYNEREINDDNKNMKIIIQIIYLQLIFQIYI